jgi:hypothetical protein
MREVKPPDFLTKEQIELFERLADKVVERRLAMPAILFLESVRPLNFIGSQAMLFFQPMLRSLFTLRDYDLIQQALERRETVGYLADLLEAKDEVLVERERAMKRQLQEQKRAARLQKRNRDKSSS